MYNASFRKQLIVCYLGRINLMHHIVLVLSSKPPTICLHQEDLMLQTRSLFLIKVQLGDKNVLELTLVLHLISVYFNQTFPLCVLHSMNVLNFFIRSTSLIMRWDVSWSVGLWNCGSKTNGQAVVIELFNQFDSFY